MSNLNIVNNILGALHTNCYFIINKQTQETIIIDPAGNTSFITKKCEKMNLNPAAILLTHGHFDHIMAAKDIKNIYKIPIYAGISEKELLSNASLNCSKMVKLSTEITADHLLNDREIINLAGFSIETISTPGHTSGSVCYYIKNDNILFSGDTLFRNGVGRTDLPTGNYDELMHSIGEKLMLLPNNTNVYPGHGIRTTIGYEKEYNSY